MLRLLKQHWLIANWHCDFNYSVAATSTNSQQLSPLTSRVGSLFIPFNHLSGNINKVATVNSHFGVWPTLKPIMTDAKTTDLASILLLASLHNRNVHVTSVTTKDDIKLIALSKEKGLKVTCDIAVYALFLSQDDYPTCPALPTAQDQKALWDNLVIIDCFSVGSLPFQLAHDMKQDVNAAFGIADTLPLLITAVCNGRLTIDDLKIRLHDNPKTIFDLHDQPTCSVEVEMDRSYKVQTGDAWSPFVGSTLKGTVQRVTFKGKTTALDGHISSDGLYGIAASVADPVATSVTSPQLRPESSHAVFATGQDEDGRHFVVPSRLFQNLPDK